MKNTDEDDYFMKPREKIEDDSDDEDVKKKPAEVVTEQVDQEATDHEQVSNLQLPLAQSFNMLPHNHSIRGSVS